MPNLQNRKSLNSLREDLEKSKMSKLKKLKKLKRLKLSKLLGEGYDKGRRLQIRHTASRRYRIFSFERGE
jgi:hypothetical protein